MARESTILRCLGIKALFGCLVYFLSTSLKESRWADWTVGISTIGDWQNISLFHTSRNATDAAGACLYDTVGPRQ
jgi:hypothetical protein